LVGARRGGKRNVDFVGVPVVYFQSTFSLRIGQVCVERKILRKTRTAQRRVFFLQKLPEIFARAIDKKRIKWYNIINTV
jgi:hypothetical protein